MTTEERLVADFGGTGLTMGPHLMAYHRTDMNRAGVVAARQHAATAGRHLHQHRWSCRRSLGLESDPASNFPTV
jgi:hypothetical protein